MNDVNTPPTEAVQPKAVKIKKSKKGTPLINDGDVAL